MLSVSFTSSKEEIIKSMRQYLIAAKIIRNNRVTMVPRYTFLCLLLLALSGLAWWSIVITVIALCMWGMLIYYFIVLPKQYYAKQPELAEPTTYTLHDDGLQVTAGTVSSVFSWDRFQTFYRSNDFYYLEYGKKQFLFLPVRVFEEDADGRREFERAVVRLSPNIEAGTPVNVLKQEKKVSFFDGLFTRAPIKKAEREEADANE